MRTLGLNASDVSVILVGMLTLGIVTPLFWGRLSDHLKAHRAVYFSTASASSALVMAIYLTVPMATEGSGSPGSMLIGTEITCSPNGLRWDHPPRWCGNGVGIPLRNEGTALRCVTKDSNVSIINIYYRNAERKRTFHNSSFSEVKVGVFNSVTGYNKSVGVSKLTARGLDVTINCTRLVLLSCNLTTSDHVTLETDDSDECSRPRVSKRFVFVLYLSLCLALNIFNPASMALVNVLSFAILRRERGSYGGQRLWGTLGQMVVGPLVALWMDRRGDKDAPSTYMPTFAMFSLLQALIACNTAVEMVVIRRGKREKLAIEKKEKFADFKRLRAILRDGGVLTMLGVVLFCGFYHGGSRSFLFWHFDEVGDPSRLTFGLALLCHSLTEVVAFRVGRWLIKRVGYGGCVIVGGVAMTARCMGYAFFNGEWLIFVLEPLQGLASGVLQNAYSTYVNAKSDDSTAATMQTIIVSLRYGVGSILHGLNNIYRILII